MELMEQNSGWNGTHAMELRMELRMELEFNPDSVWRRSSNPA